MKALICPQCGGKITDYKPWDNFAVCGYCETKFVINEEKPKPIPEPLPIISEPIYDSVENSSVNQNALIAGVVVVLLVIVGMISFGILSASKKSSDVKSTPPIYKFPSPTPAANASPIPANDLNLLAFGSEGTNPGEFKDACAIAVDSKGKIYVGDNSMRVQQFDEKGKFIKLWQVPSETANYKRARKINKIAVADDGRVYVGVGGAILIYKPDSETATQTIHFAPDYIVDFVLRSDGTLLVVSSDDDVETLRFVNKSNRQTRSIQEFHTDASDQPISPVETGLSAIRLAVDGAGNIFSVYALGDLGGYSVSMNTENLQIFRFSPEGKFVDKFAQSKDSVGIAVDNQSRVYTSETDSIRVYTKDGKPTEWISSLTSIEAFTLDRQNSIYIVLENRVIKRAAIQ